MTAMNAPATMQRAIIVGMTCLRVTHPVVKM